MALNIKFGHHYIVSDQNHGLVFSMCQAAWDQNLMSVASWPSDSAHGETVDYAPVYTEAMK